jgi:hypothetical protein
MDDQQQLPVLSTPHTYPALFIIAVFVIETRHRQRVKKTLSGNVQVSRAQVTTSMPEVGPAAASNYRMRGSGLLSRWRFLRVRSNAPATSRHYGAPSAPGSHPIRYER